MEKFSCTSLERHFHSLRLNQLIGLVPYIQRICGI